MTGLDEAAKVAMSEVIGLKQGEEVLIVTNPDHEVLPVAMALFGATKNLGGRPAMMVQERKETTSNAERLVVEALKA